MYGASLVFVVLVAAAAVASSIQSPPWGDVDFNNNRTFVRVAERRLYFPDLTPIVGTNFAGQLFYGTDAGKLVALANQSPGGGWPPVACLVVRLTIQPALLLTSRITTTMAPSPFASRKRAAAAR
jgi:hypothetical protein